jgi:tRNA pseudouridine55 synthase
MYSAVRVGGRRLHAAARAGERVERAPRRVRGDALELAAFDAAAPGGRATARVHVRCGKGTYVRTLAADLGRAVGVPAHLAALRRTAAGPFSLDRATPLEALLDLARRDPGAVAALLVPPEEALGFLPSLRVDEAQARDLRHGRALAVRPPGALFRALSADGRLLALCEGANGGARPVRVFAPPSAR